MSWPNLASRPFLNTRPVWLLTAVAIVIAVVLAVVNVRVYRVSNRALGEQLEDRDQLEGQHRELENEVRQQVAELGSVPWRRLGARVEGLNVVLREQAFSWLQMLDDVERVMPRGVRLTRIAPGIRPDSVNLVLDGVARTREDMLALLDNLIADPKFDDPLPNHEEPPEGAQAVGYTFSLMVEYLPQEDEG